MALYPTKDKELKHQLEALINGGVFQRIGTPKIADNIIDYLEQRGYHIGLPSSIEEALNSGDGSYRP